MRAFGSYFVALLIIIGIGVWMASGVIVDGGKGPGKGETTIVGAVEAAAPSSERQNLLDLAKARQADADKAAADAKLAADDAKKAAEAANAADTSGLAEQEALKKEAELKAKAADAAKLAETAATKAREQAEEAATAASDALGSFKTIAERNMASVGTGVDAPARSVRIQTFTIMPLPLEVPIRGTTEAKAIIKAVAQTTGTVEDVAVIKGQKVKPGDVLCTLDKGTREASVLQAEAAVSQANAAIAQAQTNSDANEALRAKGLAPANSGDAMMVATRAAQAGLEAATAGLDNAKTELDRTSIKAKVPGIVQGPLADVGTLLTTGAPCASIVQLDTIKFVGMVPEARIGRAKLGLDATITTVSGATAKGKVTYISSVADDATRSFQAEIEVPNPNGAILDGLTATATVNLGTIPAHLLPQSVLTLDDDGTLGVRTVKDNIVAFYPVTIVSDKREGIWVTGLPPVVDVITVGQDFVKAGEKVNAGKAEIGAQS